MAPHVQNIVIK